jgi:imidazole glycerol-phosphate synthase subunit HisH
MGNTRSVFNAFELLNEEVVITDNPEVIKKSEAIILPGVGSFADGIKNLKSKNLINILEEEVIKNKKPYLGICLGLQLLAKVGFEDGENKGFGWIEGEVIRIKSEKSTVKIPHMGWNDSKILNKKGLFKDIDNPIFYYLHSYYLKINELEKNVITSICNYGDANIASTIQKDNIYAVQFHPEKSQSIGIKLLKNFLEDIRE